MKLNLQTRNVSHSDNVCYFELVLRIKKDNKPENSLHHYVCNRYAVCDVQQKLNDNFIKFAYWIVKRIRIFFATLFLLLETSYFIYQDSSICMYVCMYVCIHTYEGELISP